MTTLAFDLETRRLASEVEEEYVDELAGESSWKRPDLFGFAVGCLVDAESGGATHFGPGEAAEMLEALRNAKTTVGYNSSQFDLSVLSAYGDVGPIRDRHVDICAAVREALEALPEAKGVDRLRSGGLDGLAKANGLEGKTGAGTDAPGLYRAGRIDELLSYCEVDTRLVSDLYRIARDRGGLRVDPYYRNADRNCVYLDRTTIPLTL